MHDSTIHFRTSRQFILLSNCSGVHSKPQYLGVRATYEHGLRSDVLCVYEMCVPCTRRLAPQIDLYDLVYTNTLLAAYVYSAP